MIKVPLGYQSTSPGFTGLFILAHDAIATNRNDCEMCDRPALSLK